MVSGSIDLVPGGVGSGGVSVVGFVDPGLGFSVVRGCLVVTPTSGTEKKNL